MNSPYEDILHTNTVPSDAECQKIRDLLVGPRAEIAALTDEIVATQAWLDELTRKRAVLTEFVDAHLELVSPIRRLPLDIVQEIFLACLPSGQNSTITEYDAPLLLCHICHSWRSVAFSTPGLWASIHIVVPSKDRMLSMDTVNKWLSKSGVLPLSISVTSMEQNVSILLHTLIRFSFRWEHSKFTFPTYDSLSPLASVTPADVPILRTVAIECFRRAFQSAPEWSNVSFMSNPSVHSASITARDTAQIPSLPLRWEQLRRLSFRDVLLTSDVALDIVQKCSLLETFSVTNLYVADRNGGNLFQFLVTPNLTCLEYVAFSSELGCIPLLSSTPSLQRLSLHGSRVSTTSLLEALSLVPTLRDLLVLGEPLSEATPDPLFISSLVRTDTVLCPDLEEITLSFRAMPDQRLLDFIQVRTHLGRLTTIHVHLRRPREIDIIPFLQPQIGAGHKIALDYECPATMSVHYCPSEGLERDDADDWAPSSQIERWTNIRAQTY
ncbi:hypothetical protein DFH07DRAFT_971058 [Mycena maculata]|uniref:F-box domain-containing protein n=1 Tax=Mycena maculata TaxID=230809 RepID=A0AAD7MN25_9AGAR|nr:hypothetical protein DFH07DRAFT_971058 [Mycena maculata]